MTLKEIRNRIRFLFTRRRMDAELAEEMLSHLELKVQKNIAAGMTPQQALETARRQLGNFTRQQEESRASWGFPRLESVAQDLRYALRGLVKTPVLTAVVVLSLAIGIGANTAIFTVINAVMLQNLPVREPQRLMLLEASYKKWPEQVVEDVEGSVYQTSDGLSLLSSLSDPTYRYFKAHSTAFDRVIAFSGNLEQANIGLSGKAETALVQAVSGDFFEGLGLAPAAGRNLMPSDDQPSVAPAAMISYRFWKSHFGGSPSLEGRTMVLNGVPVGIVGVTPSDFFGIEAGQLPDVWVPLNFYATEQQRLSPQMSLSDAKVWWLTLIGRLKTNVSQEQAEAEAKLVFVQSLHASIPTLRPDPTLPGFVLTSFARGTSDLREQFSTPLLLLMGMVGLVLLIACANVAALLLARAQARQREIAVRMSVGAARGRIVRQLLTESILLAVLGGSAGLLLACWMISALVALITEGRFSDYLAVHPDWRVFLFTAGVTLLCGVLFGLAPALRATRVDLSVSLKQQSGATAERPHFFAGKTLVGMQVALSLVLLIGAGLLTRTLQRLETVDLGFNPKQMISFHVQPGTNGYSPEELTEYYVELQRRIAALPGVRAVGLSRQNAIGEGWSRGRVEIPGYTEPNKPVGIWRHWVGPGYFETMGIPLVLGRYTGEQDTAAAPPVVVVNEGLVRKYFHGDNPVGHEITIGSGVAPATVTVVGVVTDVKYSAIRDNPPPTVYFPFAQPKTIPLGMNYVVRFSGSAAPVTGGIRRVALALDKNVPVSRMETEEEIVAQALFLERTFALLSSAFGLMALLLAAIGLYGTVAYVVSRRTNEIGIRMALGAERRVILAMVLRETLAVAIAGCAIGFPAAWLGTRLLQAQLFGLSPHDPLTLGMATGTIILVSAAAGMIPGRRASKVDPMIALRHE